MLRVWCCGNPCIYLELNNSIYQKRSKSKHSTKTGSDNSLSDVDIIIMILLICVQAAVETHVKHSKL